MNEPPPDRQRRWILHIDMDAFFASVEVMDNPALKGKPVIVGGTPEGRGVVAAASYEVRKYGVHSAMSAYRAKQLCPEAIFILPRGKRYSEVSGEFFKIFRDYTPLVEAISIDEAFLDVTRCLRIFGPAEKIGWEIKRRIQDEVGLTASVGLAPNKFLAKLASDLEKPDGFVVIDPDKIEQILTPLSVDKIWGVGKVTAQTLHKMSIRTIGDLRQFPPEILAERLGSYAPVLSNLAWGIDDRPVETEGETKSIGAERTFTKDISGAVELRDRLDAMVEEITRRLRSQGLRARTVHLKARYPDFTTHTRSVTLRRATSLTRHIRDAARDLLETRLERRRRALRLLGVSLSNFEPEDEGQLELFIDEREKKESRLDTLLDDLKDRFGSDKIRRGG